MSQDAFVFHLAPPGQSFSVTVAPIALARPPACTPPP